jgi:predicted MFS family arabinose efflux permease
MKRSVLPPGREPWDPVNGLRIGAFTGAVIGAVLIALSGVASFWIVAGCGAIGGGVGYWAEKRKQRPPPG